MPLAGRAAQGIHRPSFSYSCNSTFFSFGPFNAFIILSCCCLTTSYATLVGTDACGGQVHAWRDARRSPHGITRAGDVPYHFCATYARGGVEKGQLDAERPVHGERCVLISREQLGRCAIESRALKRVRVLVPRYTWPALNSLPLSLSSNCAVRHRPRQCLASERGRRERQERERERQEVLGTVIFYTARSSGHKITSKRPDKALHSSAASGSANRTDRDCNIFRRYPAPPDLSPSHTLPVLHAYCWSRTLLSACTMLLDQSARHCNAFPGSSNSSTSRSLPGQFTSDVYRSNTHKTCTN